jgi:hypothetical protein
MSNQSENQFSHDLSIGMGPGADLGPVDANNEGSYRRGYHQAIAEVMFVLKEGGCVTAESLCAWVEGEGMKWRKDTRLDRMIIAPALPNQ